MSFRTSPIAAALLLAGCGQAGPGPDAQQTTSAVAAIDAPTPAPADPVNAEASPAPAPMPSAPDAALPVETTGQHTPEEAARVVQAYYAAIDRGAFAAAYSLWDGEGQASQQSFADFKRGFAGTASTSVVTAAPTNGEGAAGSVYIDVPVTIDAVLKDGARQHFAGAYTLRRVNDVEGATPEQLSWHLSSAALKKD